MTTTKDEHLYFNVRFFNSVLSSLSQGVDPSHFIIKRNPGSIRPYPSARLYETNVCCLSALLSSVIS